MNKRAMVCFVVGHSWSDPTEHLTRLGGILTYRAYTCMRCGRHRRD